MSPMYSEERRGPAPKRRAALAWAVGALTAVGVIVGKLLLENLALDGTIPGDVVIMGGGSSDYSTGLVDWYDGYQRGRHGQDSALEMRAVFIIQFPADFKRTGSGSGLQGGRYPWITIGTPSALGPNETHPFRFEMDGRRKIVTVAGQQFDWSRSGLFVVKVGPHWELSPTQVIGGLEHAPLSPAVRKEIRDLTDDPVLVGDQRIEFNWERL